MTWTPDEIDWLALADEREFARAISELLSSNPVLGGKVSRPTGHPSLKELYRDVNLLAQRELESALLNTWSYASSRLVQAALVAGINKYLILHHYTFILLQCRPKPTYCPISAGDVWFPASYFIIKGSEVFDWKYGDPLDAFYNSYSQGKGRRPAITLSADKDSLYSMVPCSHSKGGKSIRVNLGVSDMYVRCNFIFRASWVMLFGDKRASNYKGLRVKSSDLVSILKMTDK